VLGENGEALYVLCELVYLGPHAEIYSVRFDDGGDGERKHAGIS